MKRILTLAFWIGFAGLSVAQETNMGLVNVEGYIEPSEISDTNTVAGRSGSTTNYDYVGPEIAEAITPEIQALARGLENDPVRIFNYVHDHIRHVLYFGSKKGAELTLLERSGNDFDQCALLVSLLRASGNTNVSYEFGMLKMPYDSGDTNDVHH